MLVLRENGPRRCVLAWIFGRSDEREENLETMCVSIWMDENSEPVSSHPLILPSHYIHTQAKVKMPPKRLARRPVPKDPICIYIYRHTKARERLVENARLELWRQGPEAQGLQTVTIRLFGSAGCRRLFGAISSSVSLQFRLAARTAVYMYIWFRAVLPKCVAARDAT